MNLGQIRWFSKSHVGLSLINNFNTFFLDNNYFNHCSFSVHHDVKMKVFKRMEHVSPTKKVNYVNPLEITVHNLEKRWEYICKYKYKCILLYKCIMPHQV